MGLSDILGSISPGFGMLSGKGLFGGSAMNSLGGSGLFGLLGMLMHHSDGADAPAAQAAGAGQMLPGTNMPVPQPLAHMNTPDLGQVANSMPGMAKASPFAALGSALQSSAAPDPGVQLTPASFGMGQQSNGLQALLQQILGQ